jgi:hypothetical protein
MKYKIKKEQDLTLRDILKLQHIESNPNDYDIPILNKLSIYCNTSIEELEKYDIEKLKKLVKLFSNRKIKFVIHRDMEIDGKLIYFRFRNEDLTTKAIIDMKKMNLLEVMKHYFYSETTELSDDWYLDNITMNEIMFLMEHYDLYKEQIVKIIPEMLKNND